jgi:hypothetical protein
MTAYAQTFCTVRDLISDAQAPIADEARLYQAIREACDHLSKEIGWFVPVTLTRRFQAPEAVTDLFVPPLLEISAISNEGQALTSVDYILKPDDGHWANGPYTKIVADIDSALLYTWSDLVDDIPITGKWGLYNRSAALTATVADTTQQSDSQLTLKLSSAGEASPGMVLLIDTEQELVTGWSDPIASTTQLNGAITNSEEILTVDSATVINIGEIVRIDFEQMLVKDRNTSTNKLYVLRGYNNTARASHLDNATLDVYRTVTVERGVNGTTAAVHANGVSVSRYFAPDDVQYLAKQIATLIVNKAKSGYQGRTGNADTGVVMYHDAFPRYDIERIRKTYDLPRVP